MRLAVLFIGTVILLPLATLDDCDCSFDAKAVNKSKALPLKLATIFSILVFSAIGVCLPISGKWVPMLRPEKDIVFVVKAFAASVILATGFIHILPDVFESLTSLCLPKSPWEDFPFTVFVAMLSAIGTLMINTIATGYYARERKPLPVIGRDKEKDTVEDGDHVPVHTHATHGRSHGSAAHRAARLSSSATT